jgi:hypothetical protein
VCKERERERQTDRHTHTYTPRAERKRERGREIVQSLDFGVRQTLVQILTPPFTSSMTLSKVV